MYGSTVQLIVTFVWWISIASAQLVSVPLLKVEHNRQPELLSCISCIDNGGLVERQAEVDQNGSDVSYYVDIELGTSTTKKYSVVVDTGSYDLWVYSSSCTNISCISHQQYGPNDSPTLQILSNQTFLIAYGQGPVSGVVGTDFVSFAGYNVSMTFGLAENVADAFNAFPIDGTLGLAASDIQLNTYPSFLSTLTADGLISRSVFSIDLGKAGDPKPGTIVFGGVDTSRFSGDIEFADVVNVRGLWVIGLDDCYVNDKAENFKGKLAMIDTGTTLILMPPADALQVHRDLVDDSSLVITDGRNYVIPCNTSTRLEFSFSGVKWPMSPSDYVGRPYDDQGNCVSNIQGTAINGTATWLLGASYLKSVYTVFDRDQMKVGFAARGFGGVDVYSDASSTSSASPSTMSVKPTSIVSSPVYSATATELPVSVSDGKSL
ncbi:aspartic peptidase domain-containing protein [Lipomyces arxii]|uniref:aspartic peptidase domain-containing protein n=1 Tax=Lipomyces arxii TaxID=56418 RepID=UPI0034CFC7E0